MKILLPFILLLASLPASALELWVLDDPDCVYCNQFKLEAAQQYDEYPITKDVPLRYIVVAENFIVRRAKWPEDFRIAYEEGRIKSFYGTPTFILYDEDIGKEVGRIGGYGRGGPEAFYENLTTIIEAYQEWKKQNPTKSDRTQ